MLQNQQPGPGIENAIMKDVSRRATLLIESLRFKLHYPLLLDKFVKEGTEDK